MRWHEMTVTQPSDRRTRGAPHEGTRVIWPAGLRARWGISEPTLWRWRRAGKIPAPDVHVGDRQGWRPETIEALERGQPSDARP